MKQGLKGCALLMRVGNSEDMPFRKASPLRIGAPHPHPLVICPTPHPRPPKIAPAPRGSMPLLSPPPESGSENFGDGK